LKPSPKKPLLQSLAVTLNLILLFAIPFQVGLLSTYRLDDQNYENFTQKSLKPIKRGGSAFF
jgi:hypothetical protein